MDYSRFLNFQYFILFCAKIFLQEISPSRNKSSCKITFPQKNKANSQAIHLLPMKTYQTWQHFPVESVFFTINPGHGNPFTSFNFMPAASCRCMSGTNLRAKVRRIPAFLPLFSQLYIGYYKRKEMSRGFLRIFRWQRIFKDFPGIFLFAYC